MSIAPTAVETRRQPERFQSIPLCVLRLVPSLRVDLYSMNEGDEEPRLFCTRTIAVPPEKLDNLEGRGHRGLYALGAEMVPVAKLLRATLKDTQQLAKLPAAEHFALLQLAYSTDIERLFRKTYADQYIDLARALGKEISQLLEDKPATGPELFNRTQHSGANYIHLTNVAAYLVLLAKKLGVKDPEKLERLAVGGLLHEIGKLFVSQDLVNKSGRLTPQERIELESSPQSGFEFLLGRSEFEFNQLLMVYQHHERFDGTGYPVAILGAEIDPWARMLAIVDVFDRMTSTRSRRRAIECADALLHISEGADRHFDPEMVLCWISIFQQA